MKLKQFFFALVAMLSFTLSAFSQETVVVNSFEELKAVLAKRTVAARASQDRNAAVDVNTPDGLIGAFGTVRLGDDIELSGMLNIGAATEITLDLNGKKITAAQGTNFHIVNLGSFIIADESTRKAGAVECAIKNGNDGNKDAYLEIRGGEFRDADGVTRSAITNYGECKVFAGKFFGDEAGLVNYNEMKIDGSSAYNVYIEGKEHSIKNAATLDVKYVIIAGTRESYLLVDGHNSAIDHDHIKYYEVALNGHGYSTLTDAVKAAVDGDFIRLFGNLTEDDKDVIEINKVVTIDGNGKTLGNAIKVVGVTDDVNITDIKVSTDNEYALQLDADVTVFVQKSELTGKGAIKASKGEVSIEKTDLYSTDRDVIHVSDDVVINMQDGYITASKKDANAKYFILGGVENCEGAKFSIMADGIDLGEAINYINLDTEKNYVKMASKFENDLYLKGYATNRKGNFVEVTNAVARVTDKNGNNGKNYVTFESALTAAKDTDIVTLLWNEGKAPIAMNGTVCGNKTVTITGTADVDWSKGWLYVGRNGEGNGKVIFDNAKLTSVSNNSTYGINVSGKKNGSANTNDGAVEIKNSTIVLDYLINKGAMTLDNSALTVKNGFAVGGRPANETVNGVDATATMTLNNGSKLVVNNHNGMGLGYEAIGIMNIDETSAFETTQKFLVTAKGAMNIAGHAKVAGELTNKGAIYLTAKDAYLETATQGLTVYTTLKEWIVVYANGAYRHGDPIVQSYKADGEVVASYHDFESAIADATKNADIARIEVKVDYEQKSVANTSNYYDINQELTIGVPAGKKYTVTGCDFAVRVNGEKAKLTVDKDLTIEGLNVVANGFATSGQNMVINGTIKALSLKQWTSNGTITVSETGKVVLGYGDGQFDMAYGNGQVVVNGNGDKTVAQFKAGYSGTRGNGGVLTINDTYFEAGAWFNVKGSNTTINVNNSLLKVSGGDSAGSLTLDETNTINLDIKSQIVVGKFSGAGAINVNTEGITEPVLVIKANMKGYTGKINVGVADYRITNDGLLVMPAVAELNGKYYYAKLQDAIDACGEGENTIRLINNVIENVTVVQTPDVKIVINGEEKTLAGTITVDGKSARYATAALTVNDVNFLVDGITTDACIRLGDGTNATRYTNNVTLSGCTFTGTDYAKVAVKSYTGGDHNLVITGCEANGLHSLAQLKNVEEGLVISKCIVNTKNGINLNQTRTATIEYNTINVKGYAVRIGVNGSTGGEITLVENLLKTDNTEGDPVIELRGAVKALKMDRNVVSGNTHITGTATTLALDKNYWDGANAPVVDPALRVNSYYFDKELTDLRYNHYGSSIIGYTDTYTIWGEAWGNAFKSYEIKVCDAAGNVMGTSSLNNVNGIINGNVNVTWSLLFDAEANKDEYWAMKWYTAPTVDNMPVTVQLWIDGAKVSEGPIVHNNPDNLYKKTAVVSKGGVIKSFHTSLINAVKDAKDGDDVTLLAGATGAGIVIDKSIAIDFNGYTYSFNEGVGSKGTETLGLQILKDNDVTLKNGTLTSEGENIKMLINNYANLTVDNMILVDATDYIQYVLSNNSGNVVVKNGSKIVADGAIAFDACKYANYALPTVTVEEGVEVTGDVEVSATIYMNGTLDGAILFDKVTGVVYAAEGLSVSTNIADHKVVYDGDKYYVVAKDYIAEVDGVQFEVLAEAVEAAKAGATVTMLKDAAGAGVVINKSLTIDFAGFTYAFNEGVGSAGTPSNGFQILKNNTVTLQNGSLKVAEGAEAKLGMIIQNYADLTVTDMTLYGEGLNKSAAGWSYVLSNNSGNVLVNGETNIYANSQGDNAFAFDACTYGNYAAPVVTVETTGEISGNIENSATLIIKGGTYTMDVNEWCPFGQYTAMPIEDPVYTHKVVTGVRFVDGEFTEYVNEENKEVEYISYERKNIPLTWTPFYVPFNVPVSQLAEQGFEVAYINGVRRDDTDFDGELDKFAMEVIYIHGGDDCDGSGKILKPNYPYFIRTKNVDNKRKDLHVALENATLFAAESKSYDCTTFTENFVITGNPSKINICSTDKALVYGVSAGQWSKITKSTSLSPFRFYMTLTSRDGSEPVDNGSSMSIVVRGEEREDGTTVIYDVNAENGESMIFDLQGRRVLETEKGMYIKNGKKVLVK